MITLTTKLLIKYIEINVNNMKVMSTCRHWPRVTCSSVSEADPGEYRLLCVVNQVKCKLCYLLTSMMNNINVKVRNMDNIIMGYCHLCGRMETPDQFTRSRERIFCCSEVDYNHHFSSNINCKCKF